MGRVAALRAELALAVLLLCSASHGLQASGPAAAMSEQTPDSPPEQRGLRAGRGETSSFDEPEDDEEQEAEQTEQEAQEAEEAEEAASAPIMLEMRAHLERRQSRENADLSGDRRGLLGGLFARIGSVLKSRYLRNVRNSLWVSLAGYLWFLFNNRTYQAPEYDD